MSAEDDGSDGILDALSRCVPTGIVNGYIVVASWIDEDGDSRIYCDTFENQRCHQSLGLLSFATAIEQRRAADSWETDDDA